MTSKLEEFQEFRLRLNEKLLHAGNLGIKRFFNLDAQAYEKGALPIKTKEFLGLATSLVLRCDDCITYHLIRCVEEGATNEELLDVFQVALVVGGSIVIPHLRRAMDHLEELRPSESKG